MEGLMRALTWLRRFDPNSPLRQRRRGPRPVASCRRHRGAAVVWASPDAETWSELDQALDLSVSWGWTAFAGEQFFAFGSSNVGVSADGVSWSRASTDTPQVRGVAHGNGRYLLVGSGPMQLSTDGSSWQSHALDCALPGARISDPVGGGAPGAAIQCGVCRGAHFTDQLSSSDGIDWRPEPDRVPAAYLPGNFLGQLNGSFIQVWKTQGPLQQLHLVCPAREAVTASGRRISSIGYLGPICRFRSG